MLIIETNISYNNDKQMADHQSRIIEVESWSEYVDSYVNQEPKNYNGTMYGYNFSRFGKVLNLEYDDFHLSCEIDNKYTITKKLAYKLDQEFELKYNV